MLYFTRWKALAIILTALVVCLCAVPNFFPEATVKGWPKWAQRHLVLGLDLQGGSYLLLEIDSNYIKKEIGKKGPGVFTLPGLLKVKRVEKPATKARQGRNPQTGEIITIQAKPKRTVVRALPLKALKEMVM